MKFRQLKDYNMRKIFLKYHTQNVVHLWIKSLQLHTVYFYCMPSCGLSKHIETKLQTLAFTLYKAF